MSVSFDQSQKSKLTHLFNEGISVYNEIDTLQGGLNEFE